MRRSLLLFAMLVALLTAASTGVSEEMRAESILFIPSDTTPAPAHTIVPAPTAAPTPTPVPSPTPTLFPVTTPEPMPTARWTGIAQTNITMRAEKSREAASLGSFREGDRVLIVDYDPEWLLVVKGTDEKWTSGYVLRHTVSDISTAQAGSLPYGATPAAYSADLVRDTPLYPSPDAEGEAIFTLTEGTRVAILSVEDGWAKVIYWRQYAYFYLDAVESLTPVYDVQTAQSGDLISAFISFYNLSEEGLNPNRMINIAVACEYISIPMAHGDSFSFNGIAGPYQYKRGYLDGMSYFEGEAVPSVGGGTCQVSSTLYNVLLPLGDGIDILYRRAHGPSGATYLPHGVDAAVGNVNLDLVFRNALGYTLQIEASAHDGVLYIAMRKA